MSQQDEERRALDKALADLADAYDHNNGIPLGTAQDYFRRGWQAARRAPEHEKAAPTAEPVACIWVIEQGTYSDYRVVGVYTNRADAEMVRDWINADEDSYDRAEVAEWPLNPAAAELNAGLKQWNVHMAYDGTVSVCRPYTSAYGIAGSCEVWRRTKAPAYRDNPLIRDLITAVVWAKDEEHAIKIVNEKRAQLIASGEFKP